MDNENRLNEMMALILDSDTVVVNSLDRDGYPVSRAMLTIKEHNSLNEMFFSTNTFSHKVIDFHSNPKASLYFYRTDRFRGVYLQGKMQVLFDQDTKNRFWSEGDERYYRFGKTDPNYCILKFIPVYGNYYCGLRIDWFKIQDGKVVFFNSDENPTIPEFLKAAYDEYLRKLAGEE